jgi:hypothetical protein
LIFRLCRVGREFGSLAESGQCGLRITPPGQLFGFRDEIAALICRRRAGSCERKEPYQQNHQSTAIIKA